MYFRESHHRQLVDRSSRSSPTYKHNVFSRIPPAAAGRSFKPNLQAQCILENPTSGSWSIVQAQPSFRCYVFSAPSRPGFNNPPASAGGIRLFDLLSARAENLTRIGALNSKSPSKHRETSVLGGV